MRRVGEESRRNREPAACLAIPRTAARKTHLTRPRSVPLPPPRSHSPRAVFRSPSNEKCPQRALGRADARAWALPKAMGGMPDVVASGSGLDRSGDGGRMRAREHGHARCGLRSGGSGELPPCEAGSLFQPDSSPPPRIHYTTMSSRAPAALLLRTNRNQPPRRNHTSRGRDPGRACAHLPVSIEPCPLFLGNQECPHLPQSITDPAA